MNRFSDWKHENLARLAHDLWEQNKQLRESLSSLKRREQIIIGTVRDWWGTAPKQPKVNDDPASW